MTEKIPRTNAEYPPTEGLLHLPGVIRRLADDLGVSSEGSWALLLSRSLAVLESADGSPVRLTHQGRTVTLEPEQARVLLTWASLRVDDLGRLVPGAPDFSGPLLHWPPGGLPPMWWVQWLLRLGLTDQPVDPRSTLLAVWDIAHSPSKRLSTTYELAYATPLPPAVARWVAQWSPKWAPSSVATARVALRRWAFEVQPATPSDDPVTFSYTFAKAKEHTPPPVGLEGLWKAWQDFYRVRTRIEVPNVPQAPSRAAVDAYLAAGLPRLNPARWTPELLADPRPEIAVLQDWASAHNATQIVLGGPVMPTWAGSRAMPSIREHQQALENPFEIDVAEMITKGVWWDCPRVLPIYPKVPEDTSQDVLPRQISPYGFNSVPLTGVPSTPPASRGVRTAKKGKFPGMDKEEPAVQATTLPTPPTTSETPPLPPTPPPTHHAPFSMSPMALGGVHPHRSAGDLIPVPDQLVRVTLTVPPNVARALSATSQWLYQQHFRAPETVPADWSEDLRGNLDKLWELFRRLQPETERKTLAEDRRIAEQVRELRRKQKAQQGWERPRKPSSTPPESTPREVPPASVMPPSVARTVQAIQETSRKPVPVTPTKPQRRGKRVEVEPTPAVHPSPAVRAAPVPPTSSTPPPAPTSPALLTAPTPSAPPPAPSTPTMFPAPSTAPYGVSRTTLEGLPLTANVSPGNVPMSRNPPLAVRMGLRREEWLGKYHRKPGVPDEYQIEFAVQALPDEEIDRYPYFLNGKPVPPEWLDILHARGWQVGDPVGFRLTDAIPHLEEYLHSPWTEAGIRLWDEQVR